MIRIFLCLFFIFSLTSEASNSPTNLDSIVKKLGFGSWEQYQKSSKICRTLLTNIQLIKQPQCNGDLDCIMKTSKIQAKKLANDLASLRASKVWKNNKCDLMVNTSKSKVLIVIKMTLMNYLQMIMEHLIPAHLSAIKEHGMKKMDTVR